MDDGYRQDPWAPVPWWHGRRWIGYSWRCWCWDAHSFGGSYDGNWKYQTHDQRAREYLMEAFT